VRELAKSHANGLQAAPASARGAETILGPRPRGCFMARSLSAATAHEADRAGKTGSESRALVCLDAPIPSRVP